MPMWRQADYLVEGRLRSQPSTQNSMRLVALYVRWSLASSLLLKARSRLAAFHTASYTIAGYLKVRLPGIIDEAKNAERVCVLLTDCIYANFICQV